MSGSPFYARIERDVLAIAKLVPRGRVVTCAAVGAHLAVVPRHVAFILSRCDQMMHHESGCQRIVGKDGIARSTAHAALVADGLTVLGDGRVAQFETVQIALGDIVGMIAPQGRPAEAPIGTPRKRRA
jgi:methylated-DNA-protein-cysteine methyltransferase related protein